MGDLGGPFAASSFVAIDFETADRHRDSACAVALVRVEGGAIVRREERLIRPPRSEFENTAIHGITWEMVSAAPPFGAAWRELEPVLAGAAFLAAHNAPFDRGVMEACCRAAGLPYPRFSWRCTVLIARARWRIYPTKLPDVCRNLGIELDHHNALSDAEACARIMLAASVPETAPETSAARGASA